MKIIYLLRKFVLLRISKEKMQLLCVTYDTFFSEKVILYKWDAKDRISVNIRGALLKKTYAIC